MDYLYNSHSSHSSRPKKHDSFLSPTSPRDVYGHSRHSRSSTRLDVPNEHLSRNKSVEERERRPYGGNDEHRSRSSVRREETYPTFSNRSKSTRRRRSWPPNPSVEDEDSALEKEHPKRRSPKQDVDEVSMPGSVDQTPVLIEVENRERKFVLVPDNGEKPIRPNSSRRRSDRERENLPSLKIEEPDLLARRQPSPYAYTKPAPPPTNRSDSNYSGSSRSDPSRAASIASDEEYPRRPRGTRTGNSSTDDRQTDDSDLEPESVRKMRERKAKARVSFTEPTTSSSRPDIKRSTSDYVSPTEARLRGPAPSLLKGVMKHTSSPMSTDDELMRRRTDSSGGFPPRAIPVPVSIPLHIRDENGLGSRPSLNEVGESDSPRSRSTYPPPAQVRPKERTSTGDYHNTNAQAPRSSSPTASGFDERDFATNIPMANGYPGGGPGYERTPSTARPDRNHARHASWDQSPLPYPSSRPPTSGVLPYPVDEPMIHMPNHEHYIDTPIRQSAPTLFRPSDLLPTERSVSSSASSPRSSMESEQPRPRSRHNSSSSSAKPDLKMSKVAAPALPLPPCPRMEPTTRYTDWYTMRKNHNVDICPSCFEAIIQPTVFRREFEKAPIRGPNVATRCDFASPWFRAAWLRTQNRQRQDLDLVHALLMIASIDPACSTSSVGPWYGILGKDGQPIPGFTICSRDFKFIELIFPTLVGMLHRVDSSDIASRVVSKCAMRISSEHFGTYLDFFEKIDEEARKEPLAESASLQQLIKYIRSSTTPPARTASSQTPITSKSTKCKRDTRIKDGLWHYMPLLPNFTVCESCFDTKVWPLVKQDSELAKQFHQVLTPLPPGIHMDGASCQLYSSRMRKVWFEATKRGEQDGALYLGRKVRERQEIEDDIRKEQRAIERKIEKEKRRNNGPLANDVIKRYKEELDALAKEWEEWE